MVEALLQSPAPLDDLDRAIINALQGGFPICERPFAVAAGQLGIGEAELLARVDVLMARKVLTRFGPLFQIERLGGAFCLAAMAVPGDRLEAVAAQVNAFPQVAHNYGRDHTLNLWFVLATETPAGVAEAVAVIEAATGYPVFSFPKEKEYFVDMRLRA
ncbi:MAG: Lrp/AsnC family transcriptional regulator [Proteobacteria bacterium]|nr:Lrp/AsnC family transcriptional regulator [Pseudomonadota bacterium]